MQIAKRLVKILHKVIPAAVDSGMARDHHIIGAGTGTSGEFGPRQRAKTPARPVAAHGVAGLFRSCEAEAPAVAGRRGGLKHKARRHRLDAAVARCQKPGTRRNADQTGHRGPVQKSGRQARTTLCPARPQNAATANSGHARPKAVATLANENTRLVGAFHTDAPLTQNWLSETGWVCRADSPHCQCLIGSPGDCCR